MEPSPTGWENVSGCKVLDACYIGLAHLSLLLCSGDPALFTCLSSSGCARLGGLSGKCLPETFNIEEPRNTL